MCGRRRRFLLLVRPAAHFCGSGVSSPLHRGSVARRVNLPHLRHLSRLRAEGCWSTFEPPFGDPEARHLVYRTTRLRAVASSGSVSLTLTGLTCSGTSRPSTGFASLSCCPYYSTDHGACQGFLENFLGSSSAIPRGSRLLQSDQRLAGLAELREYAHGKGCTSPPRRPLARLSVGVPRRGWGSHPLLT